MFILFPVLFDSGKLHAMLQGLVVFSVSMGVKLCSGFLCSKSAVSWAEAPRGDFQTGVRSHIEMACCPFSTRTQVQGRAEQDLTCCLTLTAAGAVPSLPPDSENL